MKYLNQHIIITGGSSGIGKALAKSLALQGASLTLIARDRQKLEQAQQEILEVAPSSKVHLATADVAQQPAITNAIQQAIAKMGHPELLITSAGIAHPGHFEQLPLKIFERTMAINYFGTLYSIKAALPAMLEAQRGQIVMISSGAGLIGIYGYSAYCPSKFALRGLAETLRGELKPQGIRITIVYPPDTDTPQLAAENKTKPVATKKITATAKTWSAATVAEMILRGVAAQQFAIAPGLELTILKRGHSLLAPLINWYFDKIIKKTSDVADFNYETDK